jgi:hypothetical protein
VRGAGARKQEDPGPVARRHPIAVRQDQLRPRADRHSTAEQGGRDGDEHGAVLGHRGQPHRRAAQVAGYSGGAQGECAVQGARAQLHRRGCARQAVTQQHAHSVHGVISFISVNQMACFFFY